MNLMRQLTVRALARRSHLRAHLRRMQCMKLMFLWLRSSRIHMVLTRWSHLRPHQGQMMQCLNLMLQLTRLSLLCPLLDQCRMQGLNLT